MTASEVATIGAVVTVLVQIVKRAAPDDEGGYGIYIAGAVSFLAVLLWVLSGATFPPNRTDLWAIFSGFVSVFATASGLHAISTTSTTSPPRRRRADAAPAGDRPAARGRKLRG